MKKNIITSIVLIVLTFVIFQSCEKKQLIENNKNEVSDELSYSDMPELEIKDGMLYFDSEDEYFQTVRILPNMSEEELDQWEAKLGFLSVRTIQNNFYQELESLDEESVTEQEIENLVNKYKDYVEIVINEDGEREIVPFIDDAVYKGIANANLMYQTGNYINKVFNGIIYSSSVEKINTIKELDNNNHYLSNAKKFVYETKSKTAKMTATYIRDEAWCSSDRKVKLEMKTRMYAFNPGYGGDYQYVWEVLANARGYKKTACVWSNYKNSLEFKEVYGEIYVSNNNQSSFSIPNKSKKRVRSIEGRWAKTYSSGQGYLGFVRAHGKASSRGVGNNWAIINSGY